MQIIRQLSYDFKDLKKVVLSYQQQPFCTIYLQEENAIHLVIA